MEDEEEGLVTVEDEEEDFETVEDEEEDIGALKAGGLASTEKVSIIYRFHSGGK